MRSDNFQYDYHQGYEPVGIALTSYGRRDSYYSGGALLYKNVIPVKCVRDDNGYISIGIPMEKEKTKTLK